jgi:hypothetical protein
MFESASLLALYLGFASFHLANPERQPDLWRPHLRKVSAALPWAGAVLWGIGTALWAAAQGIVSAVLVSLTALCFIGTFFVLLVPVAPRLVWGIALAGGPIALSLVLMGHLHV